MPYISQTDYSYIGVNFGEKQRHVSLMYYWPQRPIIIGQLVYNLSVEISGRRSGEFRIPARPPML